MARAAKVVVKINAVAKTAMGKGKRILRFPLRDPHVPRSISRRLTWHIRLVWNSVSLYTSLSGKAVREVC